MKEYNDVEVLSKEEFEKKYSSSSEYKDYDEYKTEKSDELYKALSTTSKLWCFLLGKDHNYIQSQIDRLFELINNE